MIEKNGTDILFEYLLYNTNGNSRLRLLTKKKMKLPIN